MDTALITEVVTQLLTLSGLPFERLEATQESDIVRVDITSPVPSRIIGWHGETLNSLQHLAKSIVRARTAAETGPFIVLDTDGYRRIQEDKVRRIAEQKADFVRRTGSRVALAPMSPYFRRIVHLHIAQHPDLQDLTTESTGEGDYRQVVLKLKSGIERTESSEELSPVIPKEDGLENLDV